MSDDTLINQNSKVSLREITKETVRSICSLSDTLSPEHQRMVAPNAVSIAEAYFNEHAWFRAIYADETPVGFVMLYIGPDDDNPQEMEYFLWRFMIAGPYQKMGFGRTALQIVIEDLKARGATLLGTSCGEGEASPFNFYRKLGFEPTGEMYGKEIALELSIV
jgi:diamine N-acetyltransferase